MTPEARRSKPFPVVTLEPLPPAGLSGGDNLLQSGFWGSFKAEAGWTPKAFRWKSPEAGGFDGRFLALERRFPAGLTMAYVPYGPALPEGLGGGTDIDPEAVGAFLSALAVALRPHLSPGSFVVRFDLCGGSRGPVGSDVPEPPPLSSPLRRAPYRVQPPDTVILPLRDSSGEAFAEEVLLAGMHKKTRYNIRLAGKKGVEVRRYRNREAQEALPRWYEIYEETGRRDGISLHPESYYRRLFDMASAPAASSASAEAAGRGGKTAGVPEFSLYMASHDDEDLAGIIVSRSGGRSTYMYGASSSRKRKLMPNYLLQWRAVADALAEGAAEYDFFGVPPADDPSHPMHGLWRFKTGFGGEIRHYLGAWDYPLKPAVYRAYAAAEKARGGLAALRKRGR